MSGRLARLAVVTAAVATLASVDLQAGSIRHDRDDADDYIPLGQHSDYAPVGSITWLFGLARGSGTLISPRWVLTAGHVVDSAGARTFRAGGTASNNGTAFGGAMNIAHESWSRDSILAGFDIGLVRLSNPVTTIAPASRFTAFDEVGRVGTSVGFGVFATGTTPANPLEVVGQKRGGTNMIDASGSSAFPGAGASLLGADFDDPANADGLNSFGSVDPLDLEYCVTSGDSGGGLFVDVGDRQYIAGVHSFVDDPFSNQTPTDPNDDSLYRDTFGSTRVSAFNQWIDDKIIRNWNNAAGGAFATAGNWTGGLPDQYDIAGFNTAGTYAVNIAAPTISHRLIARNGNVTLNLGGSTYTLTSLSYEGSLIVGRYAGNTASLTVNNGILTTRETVLGEQPLSTGTLMIGAGATWSVVGDVYAGGNCIAPGGNGTVVLNAGSNATLTGKLKLYPNGTLLVAGGSFSSASLEVAGGTAQFDSGDMTVGTLDVQGGGEVLLAPGVNKVLKAQSVTFAPTGRLDLADNKLIVTGQALTAVEASVISGRNGGAWGGGGIVTSMSDALPASALTTLAVATAGSVSKTSFGGKSVVASDVLVMYTYAGDADLSGDIDGDDFFRIDNGYPQSLPGYANGDFNYSGNIDADDYFIIDRNYSRQGAPFSAGAVASGVTAVPEPAAAAFSMLLTAALGLCGRRRRCAATR